MDRWQEGFHLCHTSPPQGYRVSILATDSITLLADVHSSILLGVDLGEANVSPQDDINVLNFRKSAYKARLQWEAYVQGYASDDDDDETVLDHSVSHDTVNSLESFSSMASLNCSNKESDEDYNKTWETDRLQEQTVAQILTHPGASGDSEATSQEQPKWPVDLELLKSRTKLGERVKPYTGPYEGRPAAPLLYGDDCRRLILASSDGRLDDVKTFVESGIKADAQHGAALIAASANNHLDVVKYLVGQGVDVNVQNGNALIKASLYGHVEVVRFLVEQGADTFSQDRSAFLLASKPEIEKILRTATQNKAS